MSDQGCCEHHHYTCAASWDDLPPTRCCTNCPCYPEWGDRLTHPNLAQMMGVRVAHVRVLRPVPAEGLPVSALTAFLTEAQRDFPGVRLGMGGFNGRLCITDMDVPACGCMTCDEANRAVAFADNFAYRLGRFMIVCEHCGDKRCPHAAWHGNACPRPGRVRVAAESMTESREDS